MTEETYAPATGHLDYYKEHGISPVRYDLSDLDAHLDRRDFLYRSLGLPPAAFKGVAVLEVAAGSGQNSLYVASLGPALYDLVEPNPTGVRDIQAAYAGFDRPHTTPNLIVEQFETFRAQRSYDIVLCENWLGSPPNELALLGKLAKLVTPGGVLVVTLVPHTGLAANVARYAMAQRLLDQKGEIGFQAQTEYLVSVFGKHLSTMSSMTRSHHDWVRDMLQNRVFLPVVLPLEEVIDSIGPDMESLSFSPRFSADWRWFKAGVGPARRLNDVALSSYRANLHNFMDWRVVSPARDPGENQRIDAKCRELHSAVSAWYGARSEAGGSAIERALAALVDALAPTDPAISAAYAEALAAWRRPTLDGDEVRDLPKFGALFGRELVYGSFTRRR
ncbi:MAG: class I SAM-dependent methyltransferase [Elsteraceae bacterium]